MKPIKMFGLAALAALMAMAFVGAPSAMAESTALCNGDSERCEAATHVHEVSVGKGVLLSSLVTVECEVLFLGDTVSGTSAPLKITGHFTYPMTGCETKSGTLCEVTETSKEATVEVLKTAHELAKVEGTAEVNVHCGSLINCTYNGERLVGHALGPLLSLSANGNVNISEQTLQKIGSLCPKESKLDLTTTPLEPTYIPTGLGYCVETIKHASGIYKDETCTTLGTRPEHVYQYTLIIAPTGGEVGKSTCYEVLLPYYGLWGKLNAFDFTCEEDDKKVPTESRYEEGKIVTVE